MLLQLPRSLNYGNPVNRQAPLNCGLTGWWLTVPQRIGGSRLRNLASGSNHGVLTSAPAWSGLRRLGGHRGITTNGTTSFVDCGEIPGLSGASKCSYSVWLYRTATGTINQWGRASAVNNRFSTIWFSDNVIYAACDTGAASGFNTSNANTKIGWNHITVVYDGTQSTDGTQLVWYMNGVLQAWAATGGIPTTVVTDTSSWCFGKYQNNSFGTGTYDDGRIWVGKALTAGEVLQLYTASRTGYRRELNWLDRPWLFSSPGIAFDAASNGGYTAAASTDTWSHINAGNWMTVSVAMLAVANVTSITYNGDALTLIGSRTSAGSLLRIEKWGMVAPDIGTFDVVVTLDAAIAWTGIAVSRHGVHQTVPTIGWASATATNGAGADDATVDIVNDAEGCIIEDILATSDGSVTVGTNQTSRANVTGAAGSGVVSDEGPVAASATTTMNETAIAAFMTWVTGGVALRPLAASGAGVVGNVIFGSRIFDSRVFGGSILKC